MCKICLFLLGSVLFVACSSSDKERETDEVCKFLGEDCSSIDYAEDGTFRIPHNPYNGTIKEYPWKEYVLAFKEPLNYPYGFDRDPEADKAPIKDEIVYISTAEGEPASFIPQLIFDTYSCYHLVDNISLDIITLKNDGNPVYLNAGAYSMYGKKDAPCSDDGLWEDLNRRVQVIPYKKITKNFIYVQVDGDGWDADEGAFTIESVTKHFDDVFGQALVYANPTPVPQEEYGIDGLLELDMQTPSDEIVRALYLNYMNGILPIVGDYDNALYHVVFAFNKVRKKWKLDACLSRDDFSISEGCLGMNFNPSNEPNGVKYQILSKGIGLYKTPYDVEIRMSTDFDSEGFYKYYLYVGGKRINFSSGDEIYTDNGYPVVPHPAAITGGAAALSMQPDYTYVPRFAEYLPYGSMVFVARRNGESNQYTLDHELGHSYGFTDVEKNYLYYDKEDLGGFTFGNDYATSETNLMSWQQPSGRKIRYRETPIACTGGTEYYLSGSGSFVGSLERSLSYASTSYGLTSIGDRQWECIRGDCFKSTLATEARKMFWLHNGYCLDMTTPTPLANEAELLDPSTDVSKILYQTDKAKYISSYENFQKLNQRVDLGKYVNKTSVESDR